jgi:hypothetical protein
MKAKQGSSGWWAGVRRFGSLLTALSPARRRLRREQRMRDAIEDAERLRRLSSLIALQNLGQCPAFKPLLSDLGLTGTSTTSEPSLHLTLKQTSSGMEVRCSGYTSVAVRLRLLDES